MTCFLIQCNLLDINQVNAFKEACEKNGYPYELYTHIPFSTDPIETKSSADYLIPYGSTSMVTRAYLQGLKGCYFDRTKFDHREWKLHRDDLLNQDAFVGTVAEAREFINRFPPMVWFIRPVDDLKAFSGQTIWSSDFNQWIDNMSHGGYTFGETKHIVVGKPAAIKAEWRYFIVNGLIVSGSMYRRMGQLYKLEEKDEKVLAEAQLKADGWLPHRNVVMDLALVGDQLKVVEFNCINGSGFYHNDVEAIVKALYKDSI